MYGKNQSFILLKLNSTRKYVLKVIYKIINLIFMLGIPVHNSLSLFKVIKVKEEV